MVMTRAAKRWRTTSTIFNINLKPLPTDIIREILLRVPARAILKFRSACKTFDRITSAPLFISAHIQRCRHDNNIDNLLVVQYSYNKNMSILNPQPDDGQKYEDTKIFSLDDLPIRLPNKNLRAVLDGLLCFSTHKIGRTKETIFTLFNPVTREHSAYSFSAHYLDRVEVVALYYHATSDTYKVLAKVFHEAFSYTGSSHVVVTFGLTKTLTTVESSCRFKVDWQSNDETVLIRGNLYGFGSQFGDPDIGDSGFEAWDFLDSSVVDAIVVFSTESEQFTHHIPLPKDFKYVTRFDSQARVVEIGGKLCICNIYKKDRTNLRGEIWVLCDDIWIKKQVVNVDVFNINRGRTYNVVACGPFPGTLINVALAILVDSCNDDIVFPEKEFTLYYLKHDIFKQHYRRRNFMKTGRMGYKETLASFSMPTDVVFQA